MANYFLAKTKRQGSDDDSGDFKTINEQHLVDALSYTETEARIKEELDNRESEWEIDSITKFKVTNIIEKDPNADVYWKVAAAFETFDDTGKIKRRTEFTLVTALNVDSAIKQTRENYSSLQVDYEIDKAEKTSILEVFHYTGPERVVKKPTAQMGIEFGEPVRQEEPEEDESEFEDVAVIKKK